MTLTNTPATAAQTLPRFDGIVEYWDAQGCQVGEPAPDDEPAGVVIICEHSSNALPLDWPELGGDLGISPETMRSHAAFDIGALGVSRGLAQSMAPACCGAVVVHAPLSRLVYDLNRAPDHLTVMPPKSEVHPVPANHGLSNAARLARLNAIAIPFHETLSRVLMRLTALDRRPALVAMHSFTPVYFGTKREVEFGILFDQDAALAHAIANAAAPTRLVTRLNEPYTAQSDVAHTVRLHALPLDLRHTMLEIRNDLIATPEQESAMAETLAPVLLDAFRAEGILTPHPNSSHPEASSSGAS